MGFGGFWGRLVAGLLVVGWVVHRTNLCIWIFFFLNVEKERVSGYESEGCGLFQCYCQIVDQLGVSHWFCFEFFVSWLLCVLLFLIWTMFFFLDC